MKLARPPCYSCGRQVLLMHTWARAGHCRSCLETRPETWLSCRVCRQERQNTPGGPWHLDPGLAWVPLQEAHNRLLAELRAHQERDPAFGYRVLVELGWWGRGKQPYRKQGG